MRHDFDDGKYTVIFDDKTGKMEALRHGEPWQDLCGNNLVYFMLSAYDSTRAEAAQLQARVAELEEAVLKLSADVQIARGGVQQLKDFANQYPSRITPAVNTVVDSILKATA